MYVYVLEISGNSVSRNISVIRLFCSTNTIAKHETSVQRLIHFVFINYVCFYMHESSLYMVIHKILSNVYYFSYLFILSVFFIISMQYCNIHYNNKIYVTTKWLKWNYFIFFLYFQKLFMQKAMSWMNHFHYGIITKYYSYLVILSLKINFQSITKYNHFTWITNYPLELYIKMCLWHWWNIQFCWVGVTLKVFYCQSFFNLCSLIECEL